MMQMVAVAVDVVEVLVQLLSVKRWLMVRRRRKMMHVMVVTHRLLSELTRRIRVQARLFGQIIAVAG